MPLRPDGAGPSAVKGTASRFAPAFHGAILDPDLPEPSMVASPNGKPAGKRFDVYRNNVAHSLVEALAAIFPAIHRLVGEEFFRAAARVHVREHPPRSRLLFEYGRDFPAFLESFAPARKLPYLPDVARLERAWLDAYHATDAAPLSRVALGAIPPERLAASRYIAHPAAWLVSSPFAIVSIFRANRGDGTRMKIRADVPETALITRPRLEVRVRAVEPGEAAFFDALMTGKTLQEAAESAMETSAEFDLGASIATMIEAGVFCRAGPTTALHESGV